MAAAGATMGLSGVALAALAAHATGPGSLEVAARFLMLHAPVLLALAALLGLGVVHPSMGRVAGLAIAAGVVLFSGDLAVRALAGVAPLRLAAPIGGVLMMIGWALLGLAALVGQRQPR